MRTIEITAYKFEELSEEAKKKAIEEYRSNGVDTSYNWNDAYESVKKFHEVFGTSEGRNSWLNFMDGGLTDDVFHMKGLRLRTYILNNFGDQIFTPKYLKAGERTKTEPKHHRMRRVRKTDYDPQGEGNFYSQYYSNIQRYYSCPLTGVCYDMDLLDPFVKFIKKPDDSDFEDLLNKAFYGLKKSLESEDEYRNSDEAIQEDIEANEYEFDEDGHRI